MTVNRQVAGVRPMLRNQETILKIAFPCSEKNYIYLLVTQRQVSMSGSALCEYRLCASISTGWFVN